MSRKLQALQIRAERLAELHAMLSENPSAPLSQDDVALIHGVSRWKIRRIEERALLKLKRAALLIAFPPNTTTDPQ